MKRQHRGVTLFEMLLVLFIISMVAVSLFQYQAKRREDAAGEALAVKLYDFSQAARAFAYNNIQAIRANQPIPGTTSFDNGRYVFTGVDWLKNTLAPDNSPYLEPEFSFSTGLQPLVLERQTANQPLQGDAAIVTTVYLISPQNPTTSDIDIRLDVGMLYQQGENDALTPKPAILSKAARDAAKMYDPQKGVSAFNFHLDLTGDFANASLQGDMKDSSVNGEAYLRVDGGNKMMGNIQFDNNNGTALQNRGITQVETIQFAPSKPTTVNDLKTLNFTNPAAASTIRTTINNLYTLNFFQDLGAGYGGAINNLKTLTFVDLPQNSIEKVRNINFLDDSALSDSQRSTNSIRNVDHLKFKSIPGEGPGTGPKGRIANVRAIEFMPFGGRIMISTFKLENEIEKTGSGYITLGRVDGSFCFLTRVKFHDGEGGKDRSCRIAAEGADWRLYADDADSCIARCLRYRFEGDLASLPPLN